MTLSNLSSQKTSHGRTGLKWANLSTTSQPTTFSSRANHYGILWAIVFYFLFLEQVQAKSIQQIVWVPSSPGNFLKCKSCERTEFIPNIKFNEQQSKGNKEKGNHALWFQVGLGLASAKINHRYHPSGTFIHGEFNVHFRKRHRVIAIGLEGEGTEAWGINTVWGSYGYSYHLPTFEAALSAGIGLSHWYHDTESSRGTIRSPKVPCLIARLELICHLPQIIGLGFFFAGNINRESPYVAGGIVVTIGVWNL